MKRVENQDLDSVMLYKKYHRNFVKQFKIGTKFKFISNNNLTELVKDGPFYFERTNYIEVRGCGYIWWELIYPGGKINKNIYICCIRNIIETLSNNLREALSLSGG